MSIEKKRRRVRLGPFTIIALLAAIGIAFAGRFGKAPPPDPNAGRVVFEADAKGHLRRVGEPSGNGTPLPRLWKPEPGLLLEQSKALNLDARQRRMVEAQNSAWLMEKTRLEQNIGQAASRATAQVHSAIPGHNISATEVKDNLADYSALSRRYDERRADYWRQSLALLTARQHDDLNKIEESIRRTK